jgi:predicted dehydrogenase
LANFSIALVGAGNMAKEHLKAFRDIKGCDVVAVVSRGKEKARTFAEQNGIPRACETVDEVFSRYKPDGIVVAVSELAVLEVMTVVSKYPWNVLVEKPAGIDYLEAKKICELFEKKRNSAFVALNRRHYSSTKALLAGLSEDESGPRIVTILDQEDPESALADGRPQKVIDRWMYANSIHLIDFFNLLCRGKLQSVNNVVPWQGLETEFVQATIQYSSGDVGLYCAHWNRPHPWSVSVSTRKKRWEMRPIEVVSYITRDSRTPVVLERSQWDMEFKPGLRLQAEEFAKHLRGESHALTNLRDGLSTMELVSMIYAS